MRFRTCRALAVALPLALACRALPGQDADARRRVDALLEALTVADLPALAPLEQQCRAADGAYRPLCLGFVALKQGELTDAIDPAITAEREFRLVVQKEPEWAAGWYGLGVSRLQLARAGAIAKEGPLQPLGASWEAGAGFTLVRSLELDPTFAPAVTALALAPIPREPPEQMQGRVEMLRRLRANLGPAAEAAVALVERAAGSRDSAVALQRRALASGVVDSGVVSLELARDLHATGLAADGRAVLIQGATTTSAIGQQAYRRMLEWVAEPEELNDWDATPTAQRSDWMRRFWGTRDVRAGWPEGTRLVEHFRRVEYAWQYFTLFLPRLGRHQVATRSQGIDTWVDYLLTKRMLGPEGLAAELAPEAGDEISLTSPENPAQRIRLTLEQLKAVGLNGPFFAFRTGQEELDDRGVVWIRYGKPTRAVRAAGGEALEVWAYDELEPRLVLQFRETNFDGQVGASTLVPTLIDVPGRFRDQFCGIEASLCTTETRSVEEIVNGYNDNTALGAKNLNAFQAVLTDRGRVNTPVIDRVVRDGKANIVRATTEDAHPHTFARSLDALVQLYGLRNLGTGEPVVLAAFALPGNELDGAPRAEAGNRIVYPVRFTLAALDARGGRIDLDTTRQFATAERLREGQFLSGALAMPVPAGRHAVSLVAEQPGGAGAMAALPALDVPGASATAWISSLVLGIEGGGLRWHSGRRAVALHPLNAYATNQPVTFYYQLGGLRAGATYRTTVELLRAGDDAAPPALTVAFEDEASEAVTEVVRTLGLENLDPARYHLRVRVEGAGYGVTAQTSLRVVEAR